MRCRSFKFAQEIQVQPATVISVFTDYSNWHHTFPATIQSAQLLDDRGDRDMVEVHHKRHGTVLNILRREGLHRITLEEYKPRYQATFLITVRPDPIGSLVSLDLDLRMKGLAVLMLPVLGPLVGRQVGRYFLEPLKFACERQVSMPADRGQPRQRKGNLV